jgi:hypothetical protein
MHALPLQFIKVSGHEGFHCYECDLQERLEELGLLHPKPQQGKGRPLFRSAMAIASRGFYLNLFMSSNAQLSNGKQLLLYFTDHM